VEETTGTTKTKHLKKIGFVVFLMMGFGLRADISISGPQF